MARLTLRQVSLRSALRQRELARLQREALPEDEPENTEMGHWWIAYDGETPAAFAGMFESLHNPEAGYLCRAGVIPRYRGRGLQRRLIHARVAKARALGYTSVHSYTVPLNPPSVNNLIACGFRMFTPPVLWAGEEACYWRKALPIS